MVFWPNSVQRVQPYGVRPNYPLKIAPRGLIFSLLRHVLISRQRNLTVALSQNNGINVNLNFPNSFPNPSTTTYLGSSLFHSFQQCSLTPPNSPMEETRPPFLYRSIRWPPPGPPAAFSRPVFHPGAPVPDRAQNLSLSLIDDFVSLFTPCLTFPTVSTFPPHLNWFVNVQKPVATLSFSRLFLPHYNGSRKTNTAIHQPTIASAPDNSSAVVDEHDL